MSLWPIVLIQLPQIMFNLIYTRSYNYSNILNFKQYNSKNIHIFNIFVVYMI